MILFGGQIACPIAWLFSDLLFPIYFNHVFQELPILLTLFYRKFQFITSISILHFPLQMGGGVKRRRIKTNNSSEIQRIFIYRRMIFLENLIILNRILPSYPKSVTTSK
jgi:hypothetical protein